MKAGLSWQLMDALFVPWQHQLATGQTATENLCHWIRTRRALYPNLSRMRCISGLFEAGKDTAGGRSLRVVCHAQHQLIHQTPALISTWALIDQITCGPKSSSRTLVYSGIQ